jgi:hypothetical protein
MKYIKKYENNKWKQLEFIELIVSSSKRGYDGGIDPYFKLVKDKVESGEVDINYILFDKGISFTPLIKCIMLADSSHINIYAQDIAFYLIEKGANVNFSNNLTLTPLYYSVYYSLFSMTNKLLKYGANVNHVNVNGQTPLHECITNKDGVHQRILLSLTKYGSDFFIEDINGFTPYQMLNKSWKNFINLNLPEIWSDIEIKAYSKKYNL